MKTIRRRKFLIGAATCLIAAPAIVRASSLMPIKVFDKKVADEEPVISTESFETWIDWPTPGWYVVNIRNEIRKIGETDNEQIYIEVQNEAWTFIGHRKA